MIVVGVGCLINVAVHQYKEYKEQARKHGLNYSDVFIPGGLWTEWINVKLVAWLTLFYFILEMPYIIIHQVSGLRYDSANYSSDTSLKHETVFTWFRYLYSCTFVCVVFKTRKDIRSKFRNLWPCCRPNVVRDLSPLPTIKPENKKKDQRKDSMPPISLSTPVLYISPEGLCLRQLAPASKPFLNYAQNDKLKKAPSFISYLCDVEPVSVTEQFSGGLDDSLNNMSRLFSKESEISITYFDRGESIQNESQDEPFKDFNPKTPESFLKPNSPPREIAANPSKLSPRKKVRFSDTVTFFRSLTPESKTTGWVTTSPTPCFVQKNTKSKHSKIPLRIQPNRSTPWKVERSRTYSISAPMSNTVNKMVQPRLRNTEFLRHQESPAFWTLNE